jgi:predicted MFS family arabinose efflux permease
MTILLVSLLAAVASLGMYTFIAPLVSTTKNGASLSIAPFLWIWGVGGIMGSILIAPLADRIKGSLLTLWIMTILSVALFLLPVAASANVWLMTLPAIVWGAVGWALQIPQNNELLRERERQGVGNLAVALNESALYLGSALGAALGGILLLQQWPAWMLATSAGAIAGLGALLQIQNVRRDASNQRLPAN